MASPDAGADKISPEVQRFLQVGTAVNSLRLLSPTPPLPCEAEHVCYTGGYHLARQHLNETRKNLRVVGFPRGLCPSALLETQSRPGSPYPTPLTMSLLSSEEKTDKGFLNLSEPIPALLSCAPSDICPMAVASRSPCEMRRLLFVRLSRSASSCRRRYQSLQT